MSTESVLQAIAVTCELTGTTLSEGAARVLAQDLLRYPEGQVLGALSRCRRELKTKLTLADVISRLDDGRPGPEEAWSMIPRDESSSVVWTEEMAEAFGAANPLLCEGDQVAARMAFVERYRVLMQKARDEGRPPKWTPSLGTDQLGREGALLEAERKGRLTAEHVSGLLPYREDQGAKLLAKLKQLSAPVQDKPIPNPLAAA
jgi:hypothetical protein